MSNSLNGIVVIGMAEFCALVMLCTATPLLMVLAFFFPALWGWVFAPVVFGVVLGAIFGLVCA